MYPDTAPESLHDQMTAQQRLRQYEIKQGSDMPLIVFAMLCLGIAAVVTGYADEIDAFLLWVGL